MPRKLARITEHDVVDCAVQSYMASVAQSFAYEFLIVVTCEEENEDGSQHHCMYTAAKERGWLENVGQVKNTEERSLAYKITLAGVDAFCRQHLLRPAVDILEWREGEIVDMVREMFRNHPHEFDDWEEVVRNRRLSEAIN